MKKTLAVIALLMLAAAAVWFGLRKTDQNVDDPGTTPVVATPAPAPANAVSPATPEPPVPTAASHGGAQASSGGQASGGTHALPGGTHSGSTHSGGAGVPHVMPRPRPEPTWVQPGQRPAGKVVIAYPALPKSNSAEQDVQQLGILFSQFRRAFKENPAGGHLNIVEALSGGNLKGLAYLDPSRQKFNEHGELLDRFGTPYFFHAESADRMEIRSAGPDKLMYSDDDVVGY